MSLIVIKSLSLAAVGILLTIAPCYTADAESSPFRNAYACSARAPSSVCIFGTVPGGKQVTLLAKDWKSSAVPKEEFANTEFENGIKTITRVEFAKSPPKDAFVIAVLAAVETVNELPFKEIQDEAIVARIGLHIKNAKELNRGPDIPLLKTRLLRLSPSILLAEAVRASPDQVGDLEKALSSGCIFCERVPLLVGPSVTDLFAEIRPEHPCGGIKFAFALSGHPYLVTSAHDCVGDAFSATLIHDLSGKQPKLIFFK